ncbi:hypothetical protein [Pseudomonas sp. PGPR40]|uniref:hypothetical protein n=1 Tax=Pseudomonas sp. PGPR40 TaxID=2913476 RepID=UPI001EDA387A|nr:hypothetical protein [Pseudomonas sp. PGPR40]
MNKYISGKVLFSKTPYEIQTNYTTKTSLYKYFNNNASTLINMRSENSLKHQWWEFEFIIEHKPGDPQMNDYRIIAEVFLPDGTLLAKGDEHLTIDFNYGIRHHQDIYLKPVFIV